MIQETETTAPKQHHLAPWQFKPGESGNPNGRPKGSISIKDAIRKHLEDNPEVLKEFVTHFTKKNKELAWQMLEGKPGQKMEHTGPNDTPLMAPSDAIISEVAKKLNEVLGTGGVGSDGNVAGIVDSQAPNQDQ